MPPLPMRNTLACLPFLLGLAIASPGAAGPHSRPASPALSPPALMEARVSGAIRHTGLAGPDRPTRAAIAQARIPERFAPDVAPPPAPPAARPPAAQLTSPPAASTSPVPVAISGQAGQEFAFVNQDRAASGARSLAWSASLARVAQYRAQDMLARGYFSHYDPASGRLAFVDLLRTGGIGYTIAGENIAWSTDSSMAGINTLFMNSPEHRDNILKPAYGQLGVGVASDGSKVMVVEVFSN
jgi:uncharacterized protein YkwD